MGDDIKRLEEEIARLPRGYISNKRIGGKVRHYLQWTDNGKIKSKYIPESEYEEIKTGIERRKELQKRLKRIPGNEARETNKELGYEMTVITGPALRRMVNYVSGWEKRDCFKSITRYLYGKETPRVCTIYGLRRTGKTTLLHQAISEMSEEAFSKAAYIKAKKTERMAMLDRDMRKLYENGYRYIFLDEITLLDDFVDTASFLSDVYALLGMKIVLSGTDSLGLWFAAHEELYDRAYTIHTTWIPYAEHARVLGLDDVDEYIRYGGTLRAGETDFDDPELKSEAVSFRDDESTRRYIDTAICGNIQHSLKCYENGSHFRHLQELCDAHELTGAINRIIENLNHRFVVEVLNEDFESSDLKLSRKNLLKERNPVLRSDVLDRIDTGEVTKRLMEILEIQNREERKVPITQSHVYEIEEYLQALELIESCTVRYDAPGKAETKTIMFTQPGMRYCQAQALVYSLKKDELFARLNEAEKEYVCGRLLDEVKGRMLEEIVLYETQRKAGEELEAFKFQFAVGEFDMVTYDKSRNVCRIYEIKHSRERAAEQSRHLTDAEKCQKTEQRFGRIIGKYILYRGESGKVENGVEYINVTEYLKGLSGPAIDEEPEKIRAIEVGGTDELPTLKM